MLDLIITTFITLIRAMVAQLKREYPDTEPDTAKRRALINDWAEAMKRVLARFAMAAYFAGNGSDEAMNREAKQKLQDAVKVQLDYLDKFALEIVNSKEWQEGWEKRAESYSNAVVEPYWVGKTKVLPLPAMPAQGTQCLGNCRCEWDVKKLPGEGNYDCKWILDKRPGMKHCQTCLVRSEEWSPLKIRAGRLEE